MTNRVEKWRSMVADELRRTGFPLPVELVLAVIHRESRGTVGAVNPSSGASGLMQVMPIALRHYNQNHTQRYRMADMRSKTTAGARAQIRVGIWILATFWRSAYRYLKRRLGAVALDDLVKIADMFYAAGPAATKRRLDKIRPTFENAKAAYPKWDRIIPAQRLWDWVADHNGQWDMDAIDKWLESNLVIEHNKTAMGAIVALLMITIAWGYMRGQNG